MTKARGASATRRAIMRSAADLFAELGYNNTSMRAVAADAGCDPALVTHYFASKEVLYDAVVEETVRPAEVIREAIERRDPEVAEWLLRHAVADWDDPVQRRRILGVLRSVSDLPAARERLRQSLLPEGVEGGGADEVRVWMISSLFIGVMTSRHMGLLDERFTHADGELVRSLSPVVASYLAPEGAASDGRRTA
ncbi:TetR/AcrR family transcriptional regulator [Streptomyces sp. 7R007]